MRVSIGVLLGIALSLTACAADQSDGGQATSRAPTSSAPAPTPDTTVAVSDSDERNAVEADFLAAQLQQCPDHYDAIVNHYETWGETLSCDRYVSTLNQLAAENAWRQRLSAECPARVRAIEDHYTTWGEMLSCDEFSAALGKLAAERKAEEERLAAIRAERQRQREEEQQRKARELEAWVAGLEAAARRDGEALVDRVCGSRGGWYYYTLDPFRVWLDHCNPGWGGGSGDGWDDWDGGDLDCEDVGEEVWVGDYDPHNLDGDGDGVGCEGW